MKLRLQLEVVLLIFWFFFPVMRTLIYIHGLLFTANTDHPLIVSLLYCDSSRLPFPPFPRSRLSPQQIVGFILMTSSSRGQYASRTVILLVIIVAFLFYSLVTSIDSWIVGGSQSNQNIVTKRVGCRCRLYIIEPYYPQIANRLLSFSTIGLLL